MMIGVAVGDVIVTRRGQARVTNVHPDTIEAWVDGSSCGSRQRLEIQRGEYVLPTSCAILRILYLSDRRVTNVQFVDPASAGIEFLPSGPPDETRFLLILNNQNYYQRHRIRPELIGRFLHLTGWVDRWGPLSHDPDIELKPSVTLDLWIERLKVIHPKTASGILYHLVLDTHTSQILWHAFQCENGWLAAPSFPVPRTPK